MLIDITMPRLSDSMEEGTILRWLVEEGQEIDRGDPLVEVETDKAEMVYEADAGGTLIEIVADAGDTFAVGALIARLDGDGSGARPTPIEQREPVAAHVATERSQARAAGVEAGSAQGNGRPNASPVARRLAEDLGVDLAAVAGTGPRGRITKRDVEGAVKRDDATAAATSNAPAAAAGAAATGTDLASSATGPKGVSEVRELTRLQQAVTRRMAESKATAPDFSLTLTVDMTAATELRTRLKEVADPCPSLNDMVVKAAALALREHPNVNAAYRDGKFELYERVNVGVAVAADDALVVPTVFDADRKSLGQIARETRELAAKVRDGTVSPPDLSAGTFTVTNLGMFGIESFTAIINPPQAAILAVGKVERRPAVGPDDRIVVRDEMKLTVVCDHRVLYGADGARFLARVKQLLEQPLVVAL